MTKWMKYTVIVVLTLLALGAVGGAAFRLGLQQGARAQFAMHKFQPGAAPSTQGAPDFPGAQGQGGPDQFFNHMGPGFPDGDRGWQQGFEHHRGFGMDGFGIFSALFHVALLAIVAAAAYMLYKKSGWRFARVDDAPAQAEKKPAKRATRS